MSRNYEKFKKTGVTTTSLKGMEKTLSKLISVGVIDSSTSVGELFGIVQNILDRDNTEVASRNINYELE